MKKSLFILYFSFCLFLLGTVTVNAYVDPSVMTYAIQAVAGLLIGLGTFFTVYWRRIAGSLRNTAKKAMEPDHLEFRDPDGETKTLSFPDEPAAASEGKLHWFSTAVVLSAAMSFMLGVYKPLQVFFTNLTEFRFDFVSIIPYILILFVILCALQIVIHTICGLFSPKLAYVSIAVATVCYYAFYIQGNILVKDLPEADGSPVDWSQFRTQNIQSILLWVILGVLILLAAHFLKRNAFLAMTRISVTAVTAVLFVLLMYLGIRNGGFSHNVSLRVTTVGLNEFSDDRNFVILIPDMLDSRTFRSLLETKDPDFADVLEDFTYYPDTMSCYPYTRYSVPQILTGKRYIRDRKFEDFYDEAMDASPLMSRMESLGYEITAYDPGEMRYGSHPERFKNVMVKGFELADPVGFELDLMRLVFFYHMPYQFKKYEPYVIYNLTHEDEKDLYSWKDPALWHWLHDNPAKIVETKQFHIVHFEGGHTPYQYTKDLDDVTGTEEATYEGNVEAAVTVLSKFIQNMKDAGVYDNSVIMIMSDHGHPNEGIEGYGRQNPLFAVKGINETHPFTVSDTRLSYMNLEEIYDNLLAEKTGEDIVSSITPSATRTYYFYQQGGEMVEQVTDSVAWDSEALVPNGVNYGQE